MDSKYKKADAIKKAAEEKGVTQKSIKEVLNGIGFMGQRQISAPNLFGNEVCILEDVLAIQKD